MILQLNHNHLERNYFDSMYDFWLERFQQEAHERCPWRSMKQRIYLIPLLLLGFGGLLLVALVYFSCTYLRHRQRRYVLTRRSSADLHESPTLVCT